jgi:hypothetical protein
MRFLIRRVQHQQESDLKKSERYILNHFYKPEIIFSTILYPIPDMVESKCWCGNEGIAMNENMKVLCSKHLIDAIGKTKLSEEKTLVVPSIDQAVKGNAFEWQPQGKDVWYKIKGTNIRVDSTLSLPREEIQKRFVEIMSQVLSDDTQLVDGDYDKDNKKLVILV